MNPFSPLRRSWMSLLLLVGAASVAHAQPFTLHKDLVYANVPTTQGNVSLRLDLYVPTGATAPVPVVLWIHGGGWSGGTKNNPGGLYLIGEGIAVASVEYRLSGQAIWPAQIHDVKGAIRWLRANQATYGLDGDRIGAFGSSAGGHLAAFVGTSGDLSTVRLGEVIVDLEGTTGGNLDQSSRVQAVSDFYGPTDFLWQNALPSMIDHNAATSPESKLIGQPIEDAPMLVSSADPTTWLSRDDPPLHIQHGTADLSVPFHQSERFYNQAKLGVGIETTFAPVPDGGHGGPGFQPALVAAFFNEQLNHNKPTSVVVSITGNSVAEGMPANGRFRLTRSGPTADPLVVRVALGGSAREGEDYAAIGPLVVIPAGQSSADVIPFPLGDSRIEGTESVILWACPDASYSIPAGSESAELMLLDNDDPTGLPTVSIVANDATATEGGTDLASFTISRTGATLLPLAVRLRRTGRAIEGDDYLPLGVVSVIPAGNASTQVVVVPIDDTTNEPVETVVLDIDSSPNYSVGASSGASVRIVDNDEGSLAQVCVVVEEDELDEGDASTRAFILTRTGATTLPLTVFYSVSGETSIGADFAPPGASRTFGVGEMFTRVMLDPIADGLVEGDESITLSVTSGAGYVLGKQASVTLRLRDADSVAPASPQARLEVASVERGGVFSFSIVGTTPLQPFTVFVALNSGFASIGTEAWLLDPASMIALYSGQFDVDGEARLAFNVPSNLPDGITLPVQFQVVTNTPNGTPRLSNRVDRLLVTPSP